MRLLPVLLFAMRGQGRFLEEEIQTNPYNSNTYPLRLAQGSPVSAAFITTQKLSKQTAAAINNTINKHKFSAEIGPIPKHQNQYETTKNDGSIY